METVALKASVIKRAPQGRVAPLPPIPPTGWSPPSSDEWTALQGMVTALGAEAWTFVAESTGLRAMAGGLSGVTLGSSVGGVPNWFNTTSLATADGDRRPLFDTLAEVPALIFDGDLESPTNDFLALPNHFDQARLSVSITAYMSDNGSRGTVAQTLLELQKFRIVARISDANPVPAVRVEGATHFTIPGGSMHSEWVTVEIEADTVGNFLRIRRAGDEWTDEAPAGWRLEASSLVANNNFAPSNFAPFAGGINRIFIMDAVGLSGAQWGIIRDFMTADLPDAPPPPDPDPDPPAEELPTPLRTVNVANQTQYNAAKADAQAGDHIVVANGATINLNGWAVNGTTENPIVVRAATVLGATLSGLGDIPADNFRLWGFNMGALNFGNLTGINFWIIRCRWTGGAGRRMQFKSQGAHLWYCELTGTGQIVIFDTAANVGGAGRTGIEGHVKGCWFHDVAMGGGFGNGNECISAGRSDQRTFVEHNTIIELCLFQRCNVGGQEDETIALKGSKITVRYCTFDDTRFLSWRHGRDNIIHGCVHMNSPTGGISMRDQGGHAYNNKMIGQSLFFVSAGNLLSTAAGGGNWWTVATSGLTPQTRWPAAYQAVVDNHNSVNRQPIVGYKYGSTIWDPLRPADQTLWRGNRGLAISTPNAGHDTNTVTQTTSPVPFVEPITLTIANVGPNAP